MKEVLEKDDTELRAAVSSAGSAMNKAQEAKSRLEEAELLSNEAAARLERVEAGHEAGDLSALRAAADGHAVATRSARRELLQARSDLVAAERAVSVAQLDACSRRDGDAAAIVASATATLEGLLPEAAKAYESVKALEHIRDEHGEQRYKLPQLLAGFGARAADVLKERTV